jgi:hypothetical protein
MGHKNVERYLAIVYQKIDYFERVEEIHFD